MSSSSQKIVVSFPLMMPLFICFLVLKMTDTIDWSWWWVTAPLWVPFCFLIGFLGIALVVAVIAAILS